ncbi:hypothetical protein CYY_001176 [Polysphondylium violaceum]|uniref:LNR domain-containing protein n=1 Tax=Polysphondylium violaceum TaxID=133409 RepID=A0A8J4Q0B4_9MYCE|nr:hypothetical protein CYY_001176 [Polysphondylium violaceum]
MERNSGFMKLLQFKFYSFLSSRWGMALCIVGAFVTFNTVFQLLTFMANQYDYNYTHEFNKQVAWNNNVGGVSYQNILCSQPIDIVYTWVNGSDPILLKAVSDLKRSKRDPTIPECVDKQVPEKDNCFKDDNTASRFVDNQELRYSLRSIESFAPWVRHVYIITNGQVPNWLDMSNPKVSIITHEDIFVNKSHLPTFSSPSIETHIHRIPGLSKKFIYLNDDVMFGREIFPDDFYTQHGGQKVFLSWPVPNCNDGCPNNWIGDGFCDQACNVTMCEFDAGDCNNSTGQMKTRWWNKNRNTNTNTANGGLTSFGTTTASNTNTNANNGGGVGFGTDKSKTFCSRGCPDSWVGDRYCDKMCRNVDCGFDAGDCGIEVMYSDMVGHDIKLNTSLIHLPNNTYSVYFNLTHVVGNGSITDGSHDNSNLVRTATISQKYKIMTLTFHKNQPYQTVAISISYDKMVMENNTSVSKSFDKSFNMTLSTQTETIPPAVVPSAVLTSLNKTKDSNTTANDEKEEQELALGVGIVSNENESDNDNNDGPMVVDEQEVDKNPPFIVTEQEDSTFYKSTPSPPINLKKVEGEEQQEGNVKEIGLLGFSTAGVRQPLMFEQDTDEQEEEQEQVLKKFKEIENNNNSNDDEADVIIQLNYKPSGSQETIADNNGNNNNNNNNNDDDDDKYQGSNQLAKHYQGMTFDQILQEKQSELLFNDILYTDDLKEVRNYRINRETERLLRDEGEVYPWETIQEQQHKSQNNRRKLLDMFGDSLKFVNRLYTKEFGSSPRKVPAHMPHMIDVDVMNEIQEKWSEQWDETSSHSLRNSKDMQYAFSFFYYIIHKKVPYNITQVWGQLDGNRDGYLSENELRTFAINLYGVPLKEPFWNQIKAHLYQVCMDHHYQTLFDAGDLDALSMIHQNHSLVEEAERIDCKITLEVIKSDNKTMEDMQKAYSKKPFYRTTIDGTDEVAFLMIENNATITQGKLDGIRQKRQKFICLNDNMNHTDPHSVKVVKVLHDFYESLFPRPSSFELPPGKLNPFTYIQDAKETVQEVKTRSHTSYYFIVCISMCVLLIIWKCRVSTSFHKSKKRSSSGARDNYKSKSNPFVV